MKTKPFLFTWGATFVALFLLNGLFHGVIAAGFFDAQLAPLGSAVRKMKDFDPAPIFLLELLLDFCLIVIITRWKNERIGRTDALRIGGLFYFSTATSWNLANAATFTTWSIPVVVVDIAWHFATGILAGWIIYKVFNRQFK